MNYDNQLTDSYQRSIDYLRISLTDRCNLRCRYCLPPEGVRRVSHADVLSYEELIELAKIFYRLGIRKWRLTGGEPLIKQNLGFLLNDLREIGSDVKLALAASG